MPAAIEQCPSMGLPATFQPDLTPKPIPRQNHEFYLPEDIASRLQPSTGGQDAHQHHILAALRVLHFRHSASEDAYLATSSKNSEKSPVLLPLSIDPAMPLHQVVEMAGTMAEDSAMERDSCSQNDGPTEMLVEFNEGEERKETKHNFDMVWRFLGEARCEVVYNASLYSLGTITALSVNFIDVLSAVINTPHIPVIDVEFPHALDQLKQLQIPLKRSRPTLIPNDLIQGFRQIVGQFGPQFALIQQNMLFTYQDVDVLSSILAERLKAQTNISESFNGAIAFCIPQSALAVILILAIVKTGCAYLPLDVRDPQGRLYSVLEESGTCLLVATDDSPDFLLGDQLPVPLINITGFLTNWKDLLAGPPPTVAAEYRSGNETACIVYTSGSTGKPKGVKLMHRNILSFASNSDVLSVAPGTNVAQVNNIAWDSHIIDIWGSLLAGATLVCFSRFDVLDPPTLSAMFQLGEIETCFFPTAVFRHLLSISPQIFRTLRSVLVGGEASHYEYISEAKAVNPQLRITNVYGPSETCAFVTKFTVEEDCPSKGPLPIGDPLDTTEVRVVDSRGRLVPPGVIGELFIGGAGVANGYHGMVEETSKAFTEVKLEGVDISPARFYHSGDRAKWGLDGQLQFLGRLSADQIKIRGQRLELSEVEATIVRTTGAKEAAVVPHKFDDSKDPVLIAYVVPRQDSNKANELVKNSGIVETWADYYDEAYADDIVKIRKEFIGWDSMITGGPIPQNEMKDWLVDTLQPFNDCRPRTVFEVGCGIGIILYQMVPSVEHFYGIEPSAEGVERLKTQLSVDGYSDKVSVWTGSADKVHTLPEFSADFILINSVAQYFPSEDYLRDSLLQLVSRCNAGGRIMLGDVRSAPLDDFLAVDIFMERWKDSMSDHTIKELLDRVAERRQYRTELLLDPAFFFDLKLQESRITHVEIIPKAFQHSNELTRYRYQVIIHVLGDQQAVSPGTWVSADAQDPEFESLPELVDDFAQGSEALLAVERIPNKLLKWESELVETISSPSIDQSAALDTLPAADTQYKGWSAFDLKELAASHGLSVRLSFARQSEGITLDAVFLKEDKISNPLISFKVTTSNSISGLRSNRIKQVAREPKRLRDVHFQDAIETMKANLPVFMTPEALFPVDWLPFTANGKVDRRMLAKLAAADYQRGLGGKQGLMSDTPQTETERIVCEFFSEILGKSCKSRSADFFAQGGHSLLATRLRSTLERHFKVPFPLQELFNGPTPELISVKVEELQLTATPMASQLTKHEFTDDYSDLSFAQKRLWFLNQLVPGGVEYNSPYILRLIGHVDEDALVRTIDEIVSRHEILRTIFVEFEGVPKSKVTDMIPRLQIFDLDPELDRKGAMVAVREHVMVPFDLTQEPPFRPILLRWGPDQRILCFSMHHIITDGQSHDVVRKELKTIYPAFAEGKPHPLPDLPIRYKDFAKWQNTEDFMDLLESQEQYWLSHLKGSKPAKFPADHQRTSPHQNEARSHILSIGPELKDKLWKFCQGEHVTWFMLLMTVFRAVHFQWTGKADASLGSPIANRHKQELEGMLGFFVNTQVFRLKVQQGQAFTDMLRKTRDISLKAFQNQDVPFDRLVSALKPQRNALQNPLIEMMVAFQTVATAPFSMSGFDVKWFGFDRCTARFDIEAHWSERPDEIRCVFFYRTAVFEHSTITRLADDLEKMLQQVVENPDFELYSDMFDANETNDEDMEVAAAAHTYDETSMEPDGPPQDDVEANICQIFERTLGAANISRQSNFFSHGGHSLLVTRACSQLKQAYNLPIEIPDVFERPTPVALAKFIEKLRSEQDAEAPANGVSTIRDALEVNGSTNGYSAATNGDNAHTNGVNGHESPATNGTEKHAQTNGHGPEESAHLNGNGTHDPLSTNGHANGYSSSTNGTSLENGHDTPEPSPTNGTNGTNGTKEASQTNGHENGVSSTNGTSLQENGHGEHSSNGHGNGVSNGTKEPSSTNGSKSVETLPEKEVQDPSSGYSSSIKSRSFENGEGDELPTHYTFRKTPGHPYLFCIPIASGIGTIFSKLSKASQGFNVVGLNDPMLSDLNLRDASSTWTTSKRAEIYYQQILQLERELCANDEQNEIAPLNLLGHSLGGNIAFEVARNALNDGRKVNLFVVDSARNPFPDYVEQLGLEAVNSQIKKTIEVVADMECQKNLKLSLDSLFGAAEVLGPVRELIQTCTRQNVECYYQHFMEAYPGHMTFFKGEANVTNGLEAKVGSVDEVLLTGVHSNLMNELAGEIAGKVGQVLSSQ